MSSTKEAKKATALILGGINTIARHLAVFLCGDLGRDAKSRDPLVKVGYRKYLMGQRCHIDEGYCAVPQDC